MGREKRKQFGNEGDGEFSWSPGEGGSDIASSCQLQMILLCDHHSLHPAKCHAVHLLVDEMFLCIHFVLGNTGRQPFLSPR